MDQLNELIPHFLNGECILFIGAGLSKIAGCYDWNSIVEEMIDHEVIKRRINPNELERNRFSNEELIDFCFQCFKENGKEHDFWGIVRKALIKDPQKFQTEYLPLINGIRKMNPFPPIITTNIDSCLEETKLFDLSKVFYEPKDFNMNNLKSLSIFHIHGYIERLKDSLLTKSKYLQRYKERNFRRFLKSIFSNYQVLFLGYSLRDSEIKNILLETGENIQSHFALIPEEDRYTDSDITVFLDIYKVKIVIYGPRKNFGRSLSNWIQHNFPQELELRR